MIEDKLKKRMPIVLVAYVVLSNGVTWTLSITATSYLLLFQFPLFIENMASVVLHYSPWPARMPQKHLQSPGEVRPAAI